MIQDSCKYCGNEISNGIGFCEYCGAENLENTNNSNIDSYNHEMFEYHITVFAAKYVYDCILQYNLASQPIENYIENLANVLRREFAEKELEKEWLDLIKIRKRFKKKYKRFQSDLNLNQQFRQKFLIYSRDLIRTILELINPKADFSNLQGIKRDIAKVLTKRILFENDNRFPEIFRHKMENSLIRLSVIKIGHTAHKRKVKVGQIELENTEIAQIADDLKTGIIISESIKQEYLDKMDRAQINQFNTFYQKLRSELKADKIYNECFGYYLQDLINHTYENVSSERDESKLLALEGYLTNQWEKLEKLTQKNQALNDKFSIEAEKIPQQRKHNIDPNEVSKHKYPELQTEKLETHPKQIIKESKQFSKPILDFRKKIIAHIKYLVNLIECTIEQKEIILSKSEIILNKHISRAKGNEITIRNNSNPLTNAAAIIYAVIVSNKRMPKISGGKLSEMVGVTRTVIPRLYNTWYKELAEKYEFDLQSAPLGRIREIFSFYIFELLLNEEIETSKLVLQLKEIIRNQKKERVMGRLSEREVKHLRDMLAHYSDTFTKYFSDLINIIKLLIISNKYHKIIGANFSIPDFARFLKNKKNIDLFASERTFITFIGEIFNFLKDTKYSYLFPIRSYSQENVQTHLVDSNEMALNRRRIIGAKLKIYLMKHIYNGKYFINNISQCPECLDEDFKFNTSSPIIKSKEFHHEGSKHFSYTVEDLYKLFNKNRGNPYFLQFLINKAESEKVRLICRCHHSMLKTSNINFFKKLICWDNIPREFPQDIFDLHPEIIHLLIWICVDSFNFTISKNNQQKVEIRAGIFRIIKKKYIIDSIYKGICPICREFIMNNHLLAFSFNHLYILRELTLEERGRRKNSMKSLFKLPCSEIVQELERQVGGYVCANCHMLIHTDMLSINRIFDDKNIVGKIIENIKKANERFKTNLIHYSDSIKDPLKIDFQMKKSFPNYFLAFSDILEEKEEISINSLINKMKLSGSAVNSFFTKRKDILERYGKIITGRGRHPTEYHLNDYGKTILRLLQYFKNYYNNSSA